MIRIILCANQGGDAGYLKVKLPNDVASIAASVTVTLDNGSKLVNDFVSGRHRPVFEVGALRFDILFVCRAAEIESDFHGGSLILSWKFDVPKNVRLATHQF